MQHCDFKNAIIIARSFITDRSDPPARWKVWIPAGANYLSTSPHFASETLISEQSALSLSPAEFTRRFWIQRGNW
ncbi:hypothetical protein DTO271D3_388 [Paecilomyces variotii]|nr:hypothetical protein DTO271D3_388 [Paecilomyces variotii]